MAASFTLTLDTTAPAGLSLALQGGAAYTATRDVSLGVGTTDGVTTGYQMKVWGDVDPAFDANVQATEGASSWITYNPALAIRLSSGDASKSITVRLRDDVLNASSTVSDSITLDSAIPVVNISTAPDRTKVSEQATANTVNFQFQSTDPIEAYKVKVVPAPNSLEGAGTQIPSTAGSTGVLVASGAGIAANTPVTVALKGTDIKTASAGDGPKEIKVFVKDAAGNWSV